MVKTNVKRDKAALCGSMAEGTTKIMQLEVFPERLLNFETAQGLIDALNEIDGIARMVVHGPRLPPEDPDNLLNGKFGIREGRFLNIKGEMVELSVQVGRIWIEVEDAEAVEKIGKACEKTLPFSFELYEGQYFRRKKTVTDYAKMGSNADELKLGMFDPKDKRARCCGEGTNMSHENEQA
jgi:methyl-coenzyme M reductase subunit D